jgi:hypothetical protein
MGFIINFVLLLLWFGIYLHLVTANKNLTNLLTAMLSFNPYHVKFFYAPCIFTRIIK